MKVFVGTDIEDIDRFKSILNFKGKLLRIFTELEYNYAIKKRLPEQSFAGIWCAKESVVKSFAKIKLINIKNVEITCNHNKPPLAKLIGINFDFEYNISVSISHTDKIANAVSILTIF